MSDTFIQNRKKAIRQVTANALKLKESAMKFWVDVGIIKLGKTPPSTTSTHKNIKKKAGEKRRYIV